MARQGDSGGAIGELSIVTSGLSAVPGPAPASAVKPETVAAAHDVPAVPLPLTAAAVTSAPRAVRPRSRRIVDEDLVRVDLRLPADVTGRAKALTRPQRTGASRTLGAAFMLQAYVRAFDQIGLDIDTAGLDADAGEDAVARVLDALHRWRDV